MNAIQSKLVNVSRFLILIIIVYLLFFTPDINSRNLQDFITIFLSIIIEAFPFVVLGVLDSVIVVLYIKTENIFKFISKNPFIANIQISFLGILYLYMSVVMSLLQEDS